MEEPKYQTKKMINKFNLFGFDFIFSKDQEIYFLEVNSFPGLLRDQDHFYKKSVLAEITASCNDSGSTLVVIYTKADYENFREAKYVCKRLKETAKDFKLLLIEEDKINEFRVKNMNDLGIKSALIFTPYQKVRRELSEQSQYTLINDINISDLSKDKYKVSNLLQKNGISIPKTFLVRDFIEQKNLDLIPSDELIIKPRYGQKGAGIFKINKNEIWEYLDNLSREEVEANIIQENITVPLQNDRYWDIRSFVLNGKYMGAVKRVSKNFIVNVSLGGETEVLDKNLEGIVGKYSELCSKIILDHIGD